MRFTTDLVSRDEWHELVGLSRFREMKEGGPMRARYYVCTDDRVIHAQNENELTLEPTNELGVYKRAPKKVLNPLDGEA